MDNRHSNNSLLSLFSRGATPPIGGIQRQPSPAPPQQPAPASNQTPSSIDSLFQQLEQSPRQAPDQTSAHNFNVYPHNLHPYGLPPSLTNSGPTTPSMSLIDEPTVIASPAATNAERQSALLSLLGGPPPASNRPAPSVPSHFQPSPPGSHRSNPSPPSHAETQGQMLLEQLMSGSNQFLDQSPHLGGDNEYSNSYMQHQDPAIEIAERSQQVHAQSSAPPSQVSLPTSPSMHPQQHPPSPPRALFDFISPFDALSSGGSQRKKALPAQHTSTTVSTNSNEDSSWTVVSDPKRQSVDNLLDTLTRPPPPATAPHNYDPYLSGPDYAGMEEARVPASLPAAPMAPPQQSYNRQNSPRANAPPMSKPQPAIGGRNGQGRFNDSPASQSGASQQGGRRDKESSPVPPRNSGRGKNVKSSRRQSAQNEVQNVVFDVSENQTAIQAPSEFVRFTPIALVRQEPSFSHGTTIGATHWVAYAMNRGRIRVISRVSGDRTLLQLPPQFPPTSLIHDMPVYGNRLAATTSDGGFFVWEFPDQVTDDILGELLLCIGPAQHEGEALKGLQWHPQEPDMLAVFSSTQVFVIDLQAITMFQHSDLTQADLPGISQSTITVNSPIAAFTWDIAHYALATITVDSTLTIWNIRDRVPFSTHKIRGDDVPSSLNFVEGGIVVGRKRGTVIQLLSMTNMAVLSTVRFVNGTEEDPEMFGHMRYDSTYQTLWVANSKRESMIALKINLASTIVDGEEAIRGGFEQMVEFSGPKSSIHFVIMTAEMDPTGEETNAACVAAKIPPGSLALAAFTVHSSGVDQIVIRKEWYESALLSTVARFPEEFAVATPVVAPVSQPAPPPAPAVISEHRPRQLPAAPAPAPVPAVAAPAPPRPRTPLSEVEPEQAPPREDVRAETKRSSKNKNVNFKEEREREQAQARGNAEAGPSTIPYDFTRDMKKLEENMHSRIQKLLVKEMEKQNNHLEGLRHEDRQDDVHRQTGMLKLISTELNSNTTKVLDKSVQNTIRQHILPALENATRAEVKNVIEDQITRGMLDVVSQNLPSQMEKLLLRPDISGHYARLLGAQLNPVIERQVNEAFTKQIAQKMTMQHQELVNEVRGEMNKIKSDLSTWQGEAFRSQESSIRDLERTVRSLAEQVKLLTRNTPASQPQPLPRQEQQHLQQAPMQGSPGGSYMSSHSQHSQGSVNNSLRGPPPQMQSNNGPLPSNAYMSAYNFPPQPPPIPQQPMHHQQQNWHPSIAAPQASHPPILPPPERSPSVDVRPDQWDDLYLGVLHTQDTSKLRDLLTQSNPDVVLPLNGQALVSQAVILTLVHRLSSLVGDAVGDTPPTDEAFKTYIWWLQRAVTVLRPEDKLITDFIPRVIPNVQGVLNTTSRRLAILPVGPQTRETARTLSDIQDTLRRKALA